jgi:AcrR family transcriptional regulator
MVLRIKPEKKEERERVALALLHATLRLAAEHGFSSLGLREVARAAGIAPTSFYRRYADMEELGLVLIEELGGDLVHDWVDPARVVATEAHRSAETLATFAFASALAQPDLLRFLLAERVGAIASFRTAIQLQLTVFSSALGRAVGADVGVEEADLHECVGEAVVALFLEACAHALHAGPGHQGLARQRLSEQIRVMLRGLSEEAVRA